MFVNDFYGFLKFEDVNLNEIVSLALIFIFATSMFFVVSRDANKSYYLQVLNISFIIFLFSFLLTGYNYIEDDSGLILEKRMTTLGYDPNFTAYFLGLGLFLNLVSLFLKQEFQNWHVVQLILIPLFLYAILETGSRGSIVALVFTFLIIPFLIASKASKLRMVGVIVLLGLFVVIYVELDESLQHRLFISFVSGESAGRDVIWNEAIRLFEQRPMLGYGAKLQLKELARAVGGSKLKATHNVYLMILLGSGLIGFCSFLLFLYKLLLNAFREFSGVGKLFFILIFYSLVSGFFVNIELSKFFWIIIAFSISVSNKAKKIVSY